MIQKFMGNKLFLLILFIHSTFRLFSQDYVVSGRVSDSATNESLAFVNIVMNDGHFGGVTDIDGRFVLTSDLPVKSLTISYVGYKPRRVMLTGEGKELRIRLQRVELELSEVLIMAGENPAHRIIRNAIKMKKVNNPANIQSFNYTSYDKMIFTVNADSLLASEGMPLDSNDLRLLQVLERQHLFMMESVAEHKYLHPDKSYDKIIATRISGLKDPLFVFLISQMQSASFYDDLITIAGVNYINPISAGADNHYYFALKDTIYGSSLGDTTFVISFKPQSGRNFDGMKGLLYINNYLWAIQNVIAEPARPNEAFEMKIQQMYKLIDGKQWFPVQLNTDITFNRINMNKVKPMGIGKSYRRDIRLDSSVVKRDMTNIALEVVPQASHQDELFWQRYRVDSLTLREINTYKVIDSLGRVNNFDAKVKGLTSLMSGKIPLGYLEMDLNRLFRYSHYEGFYAGLGLHTSDKVSRFIKAGGFWGYGFKDKETKYGADILLRLHRFDHLTLGFKYANDLEESAGVHFFDDNLSAFNPQNFRNVFINRMDKVETREILLRFRMLRYVQAGLGIDQSYKTPAFNYLFVQYPEEPIVLTSSHTFGKIKAGFKFAYGEKFIQTAENQASLGTKFPVFWAQFTASRNGFLNGGFDYNRIDFKLLYSVYTRFMGNTNFMLIGGAIDQPAPYSEMINGMGSSNNTFTIYASPGFTTMQADEFINDHFAALFITHNFGKLLFRSPYFEPELAIAFNAGAGSLKETWHHRYADFKTMERGYFEGGLLVNNLIKSSFSGLGLAVFSRAGAYSYPKFAKNLVIRLTMNYTF